MCCLDVVCILVLGKPRIERPRGVGDAEMLEHKIGRKVCSRLFSSVVFVCVCVCVHIQLYTHCTEYTV